MKRRSIRYPNITGNEVSVVPAQYGGTGVTTEAAALALMNAVPASTIGQPGGPARLLEGKLESGVFPQVGPAFLASVKISGPSQLTVNTSGTYTITNYDSYTDYTLTTVSGTASRNAQVITYNSPSSPGIAGFTINGRTVQIAIGAASVSTPTLTSPVNQSTGLSSSVTLVSSGFFTLGVSDTHESSDWQVSDNANFTSLLFSSINNSVSKLSYALTGLSANTLYYARVRHKGATLGYSDWSSAVSFSTKSSFVPSAEVATILNTHAGENGQLGVGMDMSRDGKSMVVGAPYWYGPSDLPGSSGTTGAIYFYREINSNWVLEKTMTGSYGSYYGRAVAMSGDGETCIYGSYHVDKAIYVLSRNNGNWNIQSFQDFGGAQAGWSVSISSDGNTIAYHYEPSTSPAGSGGVRIYSRASSAGGWGANGAGYKQIDGFVASGGLGFYTSISGDGNVVVVGSSSYSVQYARAYIYRKSGSTWIQEHQIDSPSGSVDGTYFGAGVSVSDNGEFVAVRSQQTNTLGGYGYINIYRRANSVWSKISSIEENSSYGYVGHKFAFSPDGLYFAVRFSFLPNNLRIYKRNENNEYVYYSTVTSTNVASNNHMCFSDDFYTSAVVTGSGPNKTISVLR